MQKIAESSREGRQRPLYKNYLYDFDDKKGNNIQSSLRKYLALLLVVLKLSLSRYLVCFQWSQIYQGRNILFTFCCPKIVMGPHRTRIRNKSFLLAPNLSRTKISRSLFKKCSWIWNQDPLTGSQEVNVKDNNKRGKYFYRHGYNFFGCVCIIITLG